MKQSSKKAPSTAGLIKVDNEITINAWGIKLNNWCPLVCVSIKWDKHPSRNYAHEFNYSNLCYLTDAEKRHAYALACEHAIAIYKEIAVQKGKKDWTRFNETVERIVCGDVTVTEDTTTVEDQTTSSEEHDEYVEELEKIAFIYLDNRFYGTNGDLRDVTRDNLLAEYRNLCKLCEHTTNKDLLALRDKVYDDLKEYFLNAFELLITLKVA